MKKRILLISVIVSINTYAQVGINTSNPQAIFHIDGAKDNPTTGTPTAVQQANDFTVTANGIVGIGTTNPNASAMLDVNVDALASGSKKGFLGPKAALTSLSDQVTIPNPATGLLIYNEGTGGLSYNGYVFWNGSEWRTLTNGNLGIGTVGSIGCNSISMTPSIYTLGTFFTGTMNVPYSGGNGGTYPSQTIGPINGLTAKLSAGNFNSGPGTLSYIVSGTPTITSPNTTTFPLNIGGQNCAAIVGGGTEISPGDLIYYKASIPSAPTNVWLSDYVSDLPVLGGKLRLDVWFMSNSSVGPNNVTMNPRLVNITTDPVKFWFSAITNVDRFNASNILIAPSSYVNLDNGIYYNLGYDDKLGISTPRTSASGASAHQEVLTMDLALDGKWYRVYYFPIVDNKNTTSKADDTRDIYLSIQRLY